MWKRRDVFSECQELHSLLPNSWGTECHYPDELLWGNHRQSLGEYLQTDSVCHMYACVMWFFFFFFISHVLWDLNHFFPKFWIPLSLPFWQLSVSVWLSSGYNLIIYSTINPARPQLSNFRVIFITSGVGNGCCHLSLLHFIFLLAQVLLLHFRKARNSSA